MSLRIRRFAPGDRASLVQVIDEVCGEGRWMRTSRFEPTPAWAHALDDTVCRDHLLLVAVDGGRVVGWCRTFPAACAREEETASLGIGLLRAYRDQGLGTRMVARSLDWARAQGLRAVALTTTPDNARAIRVFTHCGFALTGLEQEGAVEMICDLSLYYKGVDAREHNT